jgi:hypothetical protein
MDVKRLMVALGAALAISAVITSFFYFRISRQQAAARAKTKQVVAAAADLPAGMPIAAESLKVVDWPETVPLKGLVENKEDVVGRVLIYPVAANEPFLKHDLAAAASFGLTAKIPDGMRATAVRTNEVNNIARLPRGRPRDDARRCEHDLHTHGPPECTGPVSRNEDRTRSGGQARERGCHHSVGDTGAIAKIAACAESGLSPVRAAKRKRLHRSRDSARIPRPAVRRSSADHCRSTANRKGIRPCQTQDPIHRGNHRRRQGDGH